MTDESTNDDDYVVVARAVRVRGLRGEIVAQMLTDFPERFDETDELIVINAKREVTEKVEIESFFLQKDRIVLKLAGIDSIEQAGKYVGCDFAVHEDETVELEADEFFEWQLIGCQVVTVDGAEAGTVESLLPTGGVAVLVVKKQGREILIPLARDICVKVEVDARRITIDPPEGLLEM